MIDYEHADGIVYRLNSIDVREGSMIELAPTSRSRCACGHFISKGEPRVHNPRNGLKLCWTCAKALGAVEAASHAR